LILLLPLDLPARVYTSDPVGLGGRVLDGGSRLADSRCTRAAARSARSTVPKNTPSEWERTMRRIAGAAVGRWPTAPLLAAIERAAPRYARLALRARGAGLPSNVDGFPAKLAPYLGPTSETADRARLVESRLVFLLVRALVTQVLEVHGTEEGRRRLGPIEVRGEPHLDAALAEGRGLIFVSAHFGLPSLIRLIIEERGLKVIGVGAREAEQVDVVVGGSVWAAARGMQQLRAALADRQVCVLLVDTRRGPYAEPPFLYGRIPVAAGAFRLAQLSGSPLLPIFSLHTGGRPRFRVEIGPPLPVADRTSASPFTHSLAAFLQSYEAIARSYPGQLFGFDPVFDASRAASRRDGAPGPRSRNAPP